jgi:hypothetical protein
MSAAFSWQPQRASPELRFVGEEVIHDSDGCLELDRACIVCNGQGTSLQVEQS